MGLQGQSKAYLPHQIRLIPFPCVELGVTDFDVSVGNSADNQDFASGSVIESVLSPGKSSLMVIPLSSSMLGFGPNDLDAETRDATDMPNDVM